MAIWGLGLIFAGAATTQWGLYAISKQPTAGSDFRIFLGLALFAAGVVTMLVKAAMWLAGE